MANPGGIGTKFVSVNLNKSYGQPHHHAHQSSSGSYGQAGTGRGRPGSGGGGGMVVLSRPRSSQKTGPKLSVPPPMNLPSLRKEHQRFDVSGSGTGTTSGGRPGSGTRPSSSGMGWTKPAPAIGLQGKDGTGDGQVVEDVDQAGHGVEGLNQENGAYMPPSARSSGMGALVPSSTKAFLPLAEKASVLRGEDFPSLRAALPVSSGPAQKQKDSLSQKQKLGEEYSNQARDNFGSLDMRPHGHSSRQSIENGPVESVSEGHDLGRSSLADQAWKQEEYFAGPLPLVRLNPRSDWADDERDTGHGFVDRGRDSRMAKGENYWDSDFDMPRTSVLPHKPANNQYERWAQRDTETGPVVSSEVLRGDAYRRDMRTASREGNMWKSSPLPRDGNALEAVNNRNTVNSRTSVLNKDIGKDSKYVPPQFGETARDVGVTGNRESTFGRKEIVHASEGQQYLNNARESFNSRGSERMIRDRYGIEQSNRFGLQNSAGPKPSFASSGKSHTITDPIPNLGREKRAFLRNEKPYVEDLFAKDFVSAGFDERDLFSGGFVGVIKRKKDVVKQTDFHDPVRESFEAELERVQKMQELDRQRIIEEQERALEQAQREEEERQRLIREEEERRRRLEEEAREAAWRAEQERLEAIRRADEQRTAREEERRRIFLEEERRKQAAKLKLLELEAKIAKRQADAEKTDVSVSATVLEDKLPANVKENETADLDNWDESERMVERLTTSTYSETPVLGRSSEIGSRSYPPRESFSNFGDTGKSINSWRRDVFGNGSSSRMQPQDHDFGHYSPRRDASAGVRGAPRKEFNGGSGYMSSRNFMKEGMQEACIDEFGHPKEDRWNLSVDADSYNRSREIDSEFHDNFAEKYNDIGWRQGHARGSTRFPYPGRSYQNSETDEPFSYGKSRYSMRQPRVLPPPTLSTSGANEHAGTSDFVGSENTQSTGSGSTQQTGYYGGHQESSGASLAVDLQQENTAREEKKLRKDMGPRCDSQSSLSVTSPPNSPPHLSNDELDESGDSPIVFTAAGGQKISLSGNKCHVLNDDSVKDATRTASSSISAVEDEEWTENNDDLPLQEEYDEEEDGYREEDELREGDDAIDLAQEFEDMQLGERVSSPNSHNLVLGFNEGVEVAMPSDDFERNLRNEESIFDRPDTYVRIPEEQGAINGVQIDESCYQPAVGSSQSSSRSSSGRIAETEKNMQEAVMKPASVPHTSATSTLLDGVDAPSTSSVSAQQSLSPVHKPSSASQTVLPAASSTPSQADLPVKLQFGLFSGPSLIPSPVPAIQIGSIQMPLHLHPPVGTSLAHIHPSQPSIFQFGQFRYSPPISQGILPGTALPMPFIQPSLHSNYNVNQGTVGSLLTQHAEDVSSGKMADGSSLSVNKPTGFVAGSPVQSHGNVSELGSSLVRATENNAQTHKINSEASGATESKLPEEVGFQCEDKEQGSADLQSSKEQNVQPPMRIFSGGFKAQGSFSGNKGKRFTYAVKNNTARSSSAASETSFSESSGFQRRPRRTVQRTEFRIRENTDRRQLYGSLSAIDSGLDDKSNYNGRAGGGFQRSGSKRGSMSNKSMKHTVEAENSKSANNGSQNIDSENKARKDCGKDPVMKSQSLSSFNEGNLKRNISEEDVDAPLQSGVVRVFKQPGIEAPSDEDDFIEVRSKRQMLNDRREQREKEIKAKSRVLKPPRKPHTSRQNIAVSTSLNKVSAPVGGEIPEKTHSDFVATEEHGSTNKDESVGYTTSGLQPLAPIGTPAINTGGQADIRSNKSLPTPTATVVSGDGSDGVNLMFEGNKNGDAVMATSSSSWGAPRVNQQVLTLTQSQLEEAMKPVRFETHVSSVGSHSSSVSGPTLPSSKILANDKCFASTASPINSLLAGEKIQFGAVTSPTILPASSRVVSHGIGAPGSNRSDVQISHNLSATKNDCSLLFDKLPNNSSVNLQDSEAEAEAAASAVAVAAITNDEVVENGLGSATASETKIFEGDRQLGSQSRVEEPLNVSLPADLSVENPPISLWPRLPDPQNSSGQMLSHFPGGPPSHFPFYEMNPVLGGPIFSFGPHEEPVASQSQSQKSTSSGSGPLGTWQQCHSSMDSFYGPPTGFTGPFISPSGRIPGVQGPPHMVVYNHFAPVGQFGQVGLSFMGTTYITSGKHNPTTSAMGINEGDMNNMNIASTQRNTSNVPAPVQHLAPGSPLIPMASPVAMFDVSPFQPSPDMSVQARWSSVPSSSLHSAPLSQPLQQAETIPPAPFGHGQSVDQSLNVNRFTEALSSTASDGCPKFTVSTNAPAQFPDELGLVDSSRSASGPSSENAISQGFPGTATDVGKSDSLQNDISNNIRDQATSGFKSQLPRQKNVSAHQSHPTGYSYQRGSGMSQRNAAGNEWSHRRTGFHGRNQSFGAEKGFSSTKVKQIYVAKQSTSGTKTEG